MANSGICSNCGAFYRESASHRCNPKAVEIREARMSIKDQCKAVLSDGKPRTISDVSREVSDRFGRGYKVVSATIYQDLLKDPDFVVSAGRPKELTLAAHHKAAA